MLPIPCLRHLDMGVNKHTSRTEYCLIALCIRTPSKVQRQK